MARTPSDARFIRRLLKRFSSKTRELDDAEVKSLRVLFKARYHHFKLLLNANNDALDAMAEIERALSGTQPFGMSFVREQCTRVATSVFQITRHLHELAPGKYGALAAQFETIRAKTSSLLDPHSPNTEGPLVVPLAEVGIENVDQVGDKMANLGELRNCLHLKVPAGFCITAGAYYRFMEHNGLQTEIDRRIQAAGGERIDQCPRLCDTIQQLVIGASVPEELQDAILEHYELLERAEGAGVRVAVRSSALGEDSAGASSAGQYQTELNVSRENILHAYKKTVASKYSVRATSYRFNHGIRDGDVAMCVGCLRMVDAISSGVLYSRNPVNVRDECMIVDSVWGIPNAVVDGQAITDSFTVTRGKCLEIRDRRVRTKEKKSVCLPSEGVSRVDLSDEEKGKASLSDEQVLALARAAERIEGHYETPRDIEWVVVEDGSIAIVQSRPLRQSCIPQNEMGRSGSPADERSVLLRGGVTASPGVAFGPVFRVQKHTDVPRFPAGAVLVTKQALSRWAPLLDRAVAIVSERGGVVGHLATVAREFQVPAIFGLDGATDRLSNGQVVTIDADALHVSDGHVETLLQNTKRPKGLIKGSPVYRVLEGAAEHIVPLNLLDPDAVSFRVRNCKTLHDITRFCHEKSVTEMFRFGADHSFPERSSKQLVAEVPMKWWVLNLDDGFAEEVDGKYVRLDNITSLPMLALWEGITKFPWRGPPTIDGKGFLSVMFHATTNTDLNVGTSSTYVDRNYFMISKNFCSFTSRLGAHFSMAEALIGDRPGENYLSFRFKGGAADYERRRKRVFFVAEILDEYGFRTDVKRDHMLARLEDLDEEEMKKHVKIVGHLSIHTRQLDMIMNNRWRVERWRAKFKRDIDSLIGASQRQE